MVPVAIVAVLVIAAATVATISSIQSSKAAAQNAKLNAQLANQEAVAQAQVSERQARVSENALEQERRALAFDLRNEQRRIDALLAQQRQAIGASGVEFTGSPLLVAVETAREEALNLEALRFESAQRQQVLGDEALLQRFQANELRRRGLGQLAIGSFRARTIRQLGTLQAAGTALGGLAQGAQTYTAAQGSGTGSGTTATLSRLGTRGGGSGYG